MTSSLRPSVSGGTIIKHNTRHSCLVKTIIKNAVKGNESQLFSLDKWDGRSESLLQDGSIVLIAFFAHECNFVAPLPKKYNFRLKHVFYSHRHSLVCRWPGFFFFFQKRRRYTVNRLRSRKPATALTYTFYIKNKRSCGGKITLNKTQIMNCKCVRHTVRIAGRRCGLWNQV